MDEVVDATSRMEPGFNARIKQDPRHSSIVLGDGDEGQVMYLKQGHQQALIHEIGVGIYRYLGALGARKSIRSLPRPAPLRRPFRDCHGGGCSAFKPA